MITLAVVAIAIGLLLWIAWAVGAVWVTTRYVKREQGRQGRILDAIHLLLLQRVFTKKKPRPAAPPQKDWDDEKDDTQAAGGEKNLTKFDWRQPE